MLSLAGCWKPQSQGCSIWILWKLKKQSVGIVGHYDISCFGISLQMVVWFWTIPTSSIMPLSKKPSWGKISGFWKRPLWHWRCCPSSQRRGEKPDCPGLQGIRILFGGFPCISFYVLYGGFRKWGCPKSSKTLDHVSLNPFGSIWTMLVYVSINPWSRLGIPHDFFEPLMLRQVDFKDDFKPGPCLGSLNIWEFSQRDGYFNIFWANNMVILYNIIHIYILYYTVQYIICVWF